MYGLADPEEIVCPVCGQDCRRFYRRFDGTVVGCEECLEIVDAEDYLADAREQETIEKGRHWNE